MRTLSAGGPGASREKLVLLRLLVANELLRPTRSLRGLVWTRLSGAFYYNHSSEKVYEIAFDLVICSKTVKTPAGIAKCRNPPGR